MTYSSYFTIAQPIMRIVMLTNLIDDGITSALNGKITLQNTAIGAVATVALGGVAIAFGPEVALIAFCVYKAFSIIFYGMNGNKEERSVADRVAIDLIGVALGVLISL